MNIEIVAIGQKMPAWVQAGYQEYVRRMPKEIHLHLTQIPLPKRTSTASIEQLKKQEAELIIKALPKNYLMIALDERGTAWSTVELSQHLSRFRNENQSIAFIIGGPDGLAPEVLQKAQQCCSLSRLTLPHPLVRILLAEQLYRASMILQNHPYHRV